MDKMGTAAGRKFAEAHINAAVANLMAGRHWYAKPKE